MKVGTLRLAIVGGPNGCGKTTFARAYAKREGVAYLGADDVAARLSPHDPQSAQVEASRIFGQELSQALEAGTSLVIESTLAGGTLRRYIERARSKGYGITVVFVFLSSPEHCLKRIVERVAQGGHDVPEADVRRRYGRAFARFWNQYRLLADDWMVIDNSGKSFFPVATGEDAEVTVYDEDAWSRFIQRTEIEEGGKGDGASTESA